MYLLKYGILFLHDEAFTCWNKTLELSTEYVDAMWSKAMCYEELGNYNAAYQVWEEIIAWLKRRGYEVEVEEPRKRAQECKSKITD